MGNLFSSLLVITCLTLFSFTVVSSDTVSFGEIKLEANENVYTLEYAKTFEQRAKGLMNRSSLCEDCGMLFKFEQPRMAGFWMKNTLIPLDIAFVRADGMITDIKPMKPHNLNTTKSSQSVLYAWEMNKGWFAKNGIQVGDTVKIPNKEASL